MRPIRNGDGYRVSLQQSDVSRLKGALVTCDMIASMSSNDPAMVEHVVAARKALAGIIALGSKPARKKKPASTDGQPLIDRLEQINKLEGGEPIERPDEDEDTYGGPL